MKYPYLISTVTGLAILTSAGFIGFHAGSILERQNIGLASALYRQASANERLSDNLAKFQPVWCEVQGADK